MHGGGKGPTAHGGQKTRGDHAVAESRSRTGSHPGSTFNVTRYGGCARKRAGHGAECICEQRTTGARELAIPEKTSLLTNTDECADIVKKIHEEKHKDQFAQTEFGGPAQIELEKSAGRMRDREQVLRAMAEREGNSCERNPKR